ncbi:ATP-binding protein [Solibacillus silvestris]|uniref:ATP-binding protein n=1 Tax=Solibacillus silvestris TaxID=76853 RepID=UPI003F80F4F1
MVTRLKQSLTARLIITISGIVFAICVLFLLLINHYLNESIIEEMGEKALTSAYLIAERPDVNTAFSMKDPSSILQPIAEDIRQQIGATFVVIGNRQGIRYTHPDREKVGQSMVGGDNDSALIDKESIVSKTTGSMGESIRGKVPVIVDGKVIGVISVGFLTKDIKKAIDTAFLGWLQITVLVAILGIICAVLLSLYVKKQLLGMQPAQIAKLYSAYHTILEETTDGIILTTRDNDVVICNSRAKELLSALKEDLSLEKVLPERLFDEEVIRALEIPLQQQEIIISKAPLKHGERLGYLYFLRAKLEYETVTNELMLVKQQAQMQRAKTHEFANKLHVILGLLKQSHTEEAIAFIRQEQQDTTKQQQALAAQPSILIQALLEGKISEAKERGIVIAIETDDVLIDYNDEEVDALLTALGNVLQNAMDALHNANISNKQINLSIHQYKHELIIEVHDNGPGIDAEMAKQIFTLGYTTKDGYERGYGLTISEQALKKVGGSLLLEESDLGGACFLIILQRKGFNGYLAN